MKDVLNVRNENSFFIFLKLSGFALNQISPTIDTATTAMPMPDSVKDDFWGNSTILAHLHKGDIFGEAFACSGCAATVDVYADSDAVVLWFPYGKLIGADSGGTISRKLVYMFARKNVFLTNRIEHLSQRSLREKVLSFLKEQAVEAGNNSFTISLDRAGMADYLAADRSALSAMLGRLKKEGIIEYHKSSFTLLKSEDDICE